VIAQAKLHERESLSGPVNPLKVTSRGIGVEAFPRQFLQALNRRGCQWLNAMCEDAVVSDLSHSDKPLPVDRDKLLVLDCIEKRYSID
jgi:hypothetical protein